jgi:nitrate reductase alpha subunit
VADVAFPYFGGVQTPNFTANEQNGDVMVRRVPVSAPGTGRTRRPGPRDGGHRVRPAGWRNYGIDRGLPGEEAGGSYDDDRPYTPAWQESITGVPREQIITVARQFADNADKTHGKSMVIIGAAMNHWYHCDMNYRGIINMLMMCGCIGQSGGGWAHYVGQEKLRPRPAGRRWPSRSTGSARRAR